MVLMDRLECLKSEILGESRNGLEIGQMIVNCGQLLLKRLWDGKMKMMEHFAWVLRTFHNISPL